MSLTKIWIFSIKPPNTVSSEAFTSLWKEVLDFCRSRAPPAANHQLWQDTTEPSRVVLLSGYPSQEATDAADSEYLKTYGSRMGALVTHVGFHQLAADTGLLPLGSESLVIRVTEHGDRTDQNRPSHIGKIISGEFGGEDQLDARKPQNERKEIYVCLTGVRDTDVSYWLNDQEPGVTTYACEKLPCKR